MQYFFMINPQSTINIAICNKECESIIIVFITGVVGLKHVRVHVPMAVKEGETALLLCFFDLEGDALYSVKWYKGGREIFRYIPRETPSIKIFPIPGLEELNIEVGI